MDFPIVQTIGLLRCFHESAGLAKPHRHGPIAHGRRVRRRAAHFCWLVAAAARHIRVMDNRQSTELAAWVTEAGPTGKPETALLSGFCERAAAAGVTLARASLIVDTLHPIHEGRVFRWQRGEHETSLLEYGRTTEGAAAKAWRRSPFYHLVQSGEPFLHRRLVGARAAAFPVIEDMRALGITDYLAMN